MKNGKAYLVVDNKEVPADDVENVTDSAILGLDNQPTNALSSLERLYNLQDKISN